MQREEKNDKVATENGQFSNVKCKRKFIYIYTVGRISYNILGILYILIQLQVNLKIYIYSQVPDQYLIIEYSIPADLDGKHFSHFITLCLLAALVHLHVFLLHTFLLLLVQTVDV